MRTLITVLAMGAAALATPAFADTLTEVTTKGMIITIADMDLEVKFTPDHKFTAADDQITGVWRIDGDKLCTTSNLDPAESCAVYPKDKKSGDKFEVTGPGGAAMVRIK